MRKWIMLLVMVGIGAGGGSVNAKGKDVAQMENQAQQIIQEYVAEFEPLDVGARKAWWVYNTTGDKKYSDRAAELDLKMRTLDSDADRFAKLKELYRHRKKFQNDILRRQVELLYLRHLPNQIAPDKLKRLVELEKRLGETTNDYQPMIDGKKVSTVDVSQVLAKSTDSAELEKNWKAQKASGGILEKDFRELVALRNEIARDLGYANALELAAVTQQMDMKVLERFYRDVKRATEKPFKKLKGEYIDPRLAKRYGIGVSELKPWHYQNAFFQVAPNAIFGQVDLDAFYDTKDASDVIGLTEKLYGSMGVDVRPIIERSSLFPKPGKNPHAFAEYLDPNKPNSSVLLMNLPRSPQNPTADNAATLAHELGHDINYEAVIGNAQLPYLLRDPTMLTEAFAMLMERQTKTADWFARLGVDAETARAAAEGVEMIEYVDQLIFLRWASTIFCFEKNFYENPDQDIGDLWWQCKETHQLLARPEGWENPDALAKYHIPNVPPLYYANYAIGQVANVQFAELFAKRIGASKPQGLSYFDQKTLGDWLMTDFLAQGERYPWDAFLKQSTGKPLSVAAWKRYYVDSDIPKRLFAQP